MQTLSIRLVGGRTIHTHNPETLTRLRSRRLAAVASSKLIPRCEPSICETCRLQADNARLASPFTLVSDIAAIGRSLGASMVEAGPAGVVAIRRKS